MQLIKHLEPGIQHTHTYVCVERERKICFECWQRHNYSFREE